jgi:hypothetical protein
VPDGLGEAIALVGRNKIFDWLSIVAHSRHDLVARFTAHQLARGELRARLLRCQRPAMHRALPASRISCAIPLMSVRGVGAIVSLTFAAAIDDPAIAVPFRC